MRQLTTGSHAGSPVVAASSALATQPPRLQASHPLEGEWGHDAINAMPPSLAELLTRIAGAPRDARFEYASLVTENGVPRARLMRLGNKAVAHLDATPKLTDPLRAWHVVVHMFTPIDGGGTLREFSERVVRPMRSSNQSDDEMWEPSHFPTELQHVVEASLPRRKPDWEWAGSIRYSMSGAPDRTELWHLVHAAGRIAVAAGEETGSAVSAKLFLSDVDLSRTTRAEIDLPPELPRVGAGADHTLGRLLTLARPSANQ